MGADGFDLMNLAEVAFEIPPATNWLLLGDLQRLLAMRKRNHKALAIRMLEHDAPIERIVEAPSRIEPNLSWSIGIPTSVNLQS